RGRVLFGCRRRGDTLSIEIWDTGPGIPDDQQARVFHEFQRLPQLGRRQIKGLGLGLAIADRICRLLEHRISVRSWPGRGTVFAVSVPLVVGEAEVASSPEPVVSDQRDVAGLRVFCVDNDPALLASLEALLRALGCDPIVARSRADALEEARGRPAPDLLLVDYQLDDGETGFQVIDALDGCWEDVVPAMLITADRRAEVRVRAREQGVGFLQKPVSEAALLEVLRAL
ncbi:MAG: ATP-binding protein, partial [Alloalcanivorax venustensis]